MVQCTLGGKGGGAVHAALQQRRPLSEMHLADYDSTSVHDSSCDSSKVIFLYL